MSVDIWNLVCGQKIKYAYPDNGMKFDQEQANKYLIKEKEYTIANFEIGNWITYIELKEFPNINFNSVLFSEV